MDADEALLPRVERFEDYCIQKRSLEGEVECALARRDEKAMEGVNIAERELEDTKRECAEVEARIEKARRGDFSSRERSQGAVKCHSGASEVTAQECQPPLAAGTGPQSPVAQITRSDSYENISPPTASLIPTSTADSESLSRSATSGPDHSTTGTGYKSFDATENDVSDNFLTFLVRQYADLCDEQRAVQEEIEKMLERKERVAREKLTCARTELDNTRQNAVEIVGALMEASGGDAQIRVPKSNLHSVEARSDLVSEAEFRYPSGFTAPPSPFHPNTLSPGSSISGKASMAMSISPPVSQVAYKSPPQPVIALHSELVNASTTLPPSLISQTTAPSTKAIPTSNPKVEEWEAAIFRMYDSHMAAAVAAGSSVSFMNLPWPVLEFEANCYSPATIKDKDIKQDVVSDFIETYSAWKGWSFQTARKKMKSDWESVQKVFTNARAGKKRVDSVLECITAAV